MRLNRFAMQFFTPTTHSVYHRSHQLTIADHCQTSRYPPPPPPPTSQYVECKANARNDC